LYIRGEYDVEALGWAEKTREELKLRQQKYAATSP
jgi:hypothetical protein